MRFPQIGKPILRQGTAEAVHFYLYISPWLMGFLVFTLGAMVFSFSMSLTDWSVLRSQRWVGLGNYRDLLDDPLFWRSIGVTTYYACLAVPLSLASGLAIAIVLNQKVRAMPVFRTVIYMPSLVSGVAQALLWVWIFNPEFGLLNWMLGLVGIQGPQWIFIPEWAVPSFILMSLWAVGGGMLIFLAGLQGIPTALYEAAEIDGASAPRRFRYVTLPVLSPVIFFNLVMGIINSFQIFTQAYVMTAGGPANSTLFFVLYIYRQGFEYFYMGYASSLAWVLFLIIFSLSLMVIRSSSAWVYYEGELRGR